MARKRQIMHPMAYDKHSAQLVRIDTGAALSVFPKQNERANPDTAQPLEAVNGSVIKTFGSELVKLHLGNKVFTHNVVLAALWSLSWDGTSWYKTD